LNTLAALRANDAELAKLVALWKQREGEPKILSHIEAIRQCLSGARDTSMQITIALQVQDITSQQIAGVLHLIEEVRLRLARTLYQVERQVEHIHNSGSTEKPIKGSFDMNASYSISSDRQSSADEIIQQWTAQQIKK
jgi:chemotaxis regulatin CheY-phosphate phosphatase CheZ